MPEVEYRHIVQRPVDIVWVFIKEVNNWATLFPGYQKHEILNDAYSIWELLGDLGVLSRVLRVQIHKLDWSRLVLEF